MKLFVFCILYAAAYSLPTANLQGENAAKNESALDLRSYDPYEAKIGQFPWEAYLIINDGNSQFTCGGSLLRSQWVLTAAHCLVKLDFVATEITISLGIVDTRVTVLKVTRNSSNYFIHNKYNEETLENDIALIKLNKPVNDTGNVKSITLEWGQISPKSEPWATGFGNIAATPTEARYKRLFFTDVKTITNFQCRKEFNRNLPDSIICGTSKLNFVFYVGDAGSALIMLENGKFKQYAVSSSNLYNNDSSYTTTFTRVSYYRDWIRQTMEREE